ncbi:iron-sulfur protein [Streptomyces spiroverticillatus]|uniref:Iron-sulfur protein n=1 Tax=Streptomyces finlayi TaxID=67296 RepID=A0A918X2S3_9ACTN|nr:PDR/VanB family oxidoreductase [Streptomyces finlayi]GGZ94027.1 iron-sulfur protein [Streptomyces spiroverticillatus]GHD06498.1 iron-sulfur protein [Streptomyces finlayi]
MPRVRTYLIAAGAASLAVVARRALRGRVQESPLWPMPALEEPISGQRRSSGTTRVLVSGRSEPAEGVVQLHLEAMDAGDLPPWEPGAHLDLVLPSGLVRQYSLCGDPADRASYTVATRLITEETGGRGGSLEVHEQIHEGSELEVRGPRNRFALVESASYVFVAGGIGITPLLPMLRAAEAAGAEWRLLYGGRSRATMPFLEEVEKLGVSSERVRIVAEDEDGLPDLGALWADVPQGTAVYACGPEGLLGAVEGSLPEHCSLHVERFAPGANAGGSGAFEVELRRSGEVVRVAADQSVLAALKPVVPNVSYSCEQGFCGTCQQRVIEGEIDHRDELLTDSERDDSLLICVSRAAGERLVLDL